MQTIKQLVCPECLKAFTMDEWLSQEIVPEIRADYDGSQQAEYDDPQCPRCEAYLEEMDVCEECGEVPSKCTCAPVSFNEMVARDENLNPVFRGLFGGVK